MYNILIVDDSDIDRMMIESNLRIPDAVCIAADNGQKALEKLKEWQIDLVLTDLVMPRMDGLELVRAMRKDFPSIPVIVTTGVGSEDTAAEALNAGAASYIPKNNLAEMLRPGVQRVLDISKSNDMPSPLFDCTKAMHLEMDIGNDPGKLRSLVDFTDRLLDVVTPLERNDRLRISIAIEQALNNALYRGNLEIDSDYKIPFVQRTSDLKHQELVERRMETPPYKDRRIQVVIDIKPKRFAMRVRDGGKGFDPSVAGNWDNPDARGIILMKAFMHVVEYAKEGNDVQLYYFFDREPQSKSEEAAQPKQSGAPASGPIATRQRTPTGKKVAQLKSMKTGKTIALQEQKTVIGSRSGCHVQLSPNSQVAPLQCVILSEPGNYILVQLAPQHPTLVNTTQVEGRTRLKSGDVINLGRNDFEFELVNADS